MAELVQDALDAQTTDLPEVLMDRGERGDVVRGLREIVEPHHADVVGDGASGLRQRAQGMERSAVFVANAVTKMQIVRLAKEVGMYAYERCFDASSEPQWETKVKARIEHGTDPDA